MKEEQKEQIVGYRLAKKSLSVDQAPIYTFVIEEKLMPGDILKWDSGESKIVRVGNNTVNT